MTGPVAPQHGLSAGNSAAFNPASRLLVIAPHPDDETIAAAGLLQAARAAGARVGVWLLTDGENNPWPQRWAERRWRIDAAARCRWGARRRAESAAALQRLGLEPAAVLRAFGWPDGGITERFITDPAGLVALLAAELAAFAPTDLVVPAATDSHPDHGMAGILALLAARQAGLAARILSYRVHGGQVPPSARVCQLGADHWAAKQQAVAAFATQSVLTGPRLRHMAGRHEAFLPDLFWPWRGRTPAWRLQTGSGGRILVGDLGWPSPALGRQRLIVVAAPAGGGPPAVQVVAGPALAARARHRAGAIQLTVPGVAPENWQLFVKLEPVRRSLWIFDRYPWHRLPAQAQMDTAGIPGRQTRDPSQ